MQSQDISLSYGIRRSPSIGNEGELSECVNLIPKNGELVNILPPKEIGITLPESDAVLVYYHRTSLFVHYIYRAVGGNTLFFIDADGTSKPLEGNYQDFNEAHSIGNTLIIITGSGMRYHIWDTANGNYKYIGEKPPFPSISFGLKATPVSTSWTVVELPEEINLLGFENIEDITFSEDNMDAISNSVMGGVSKFIREETVDKNRMIYPFFLRYCYRLYDGSTTMISAPILMTPSTGINPYVLGQFFEDNNSAYKYKVLAATCAIDYLIGGLGSDATDWKDVVKSVDIFMSSPISSFDYNGDIQGHEAMDADTTASFGIFMFGDTPGYKRYTAKDIIEECVDPADLEPVLGVLYPRRLILPKKETTDMETYSSLVYKIASISFEDACSQSLSSNRRELEIDNYALDSLESRESLKDSTGYQTLDRLVPGMGYSYNSRLNIANLTRELFKGYSLISMVCYASDYAVAQKNYKVNTFIREGDKEIVVSSDPSTIDALPFYLFYPNTNAYKMEVVDQSGGRVATVNLSPHPILNGSYYFSNYDDLTFTSGSGSSASPDRIVEMPNKIYTSEVNNPFYFPLAGINTVGTGEIMAIRSATRALSQGQFGQFPLYAFSTDGIWALQVSDEGLYSSVQPVSRDVCDNPAAITQIDSAVVFTTTAGLKVISGSEINLISSSMEGENTDETDYNIMPDFSSLFVPDTERFVETLSTCRISYDYANSMLRIYPEGSDKYYVYSLESGEYSTYVGEALTTVVEGYPSSIIQVGTKLYTFDKIVSDDKRKGVAITRPMAFGDPFIMKMLIDLKTIGQLSKGSYCKIGVFVSNDKNTWYRLGSLRKRPFKYYRFVYFSEMGDLDTLSGTRVIYDLRRANKLR